MVVTFPEKELILIIVFAFLKNHLLNRTILRYSAPLSGVYQGVSDRQCGTRPSEIAFPRHYHPLAPFLDIHTTKNRVTILKSLTIETGSRQVPWNPSGTRKCVYHYHFFFNSTRETDRCYRRVQTCSRQVPDRFQTGSRWVPWNPSGTR